MARADDPYAHTYKQLYASVFAHFARASGRPAKAIAHTAGCTDAYLSMIANAQRLPTLEKTQDLDRALNADGCLYEVRRLINRLESQRAAQGSSLEGGPQTSGQGDDDVKRRAAIQLLAALGVGASTHATEPLRHLVDLALTAEPRDLDDWHLACDDHLHAIRTRPPAQAQEDLVVDLLALGSHLKAADAMNMTELRRVEAALATLHANVLTRLGDHGAALRWWRTAKAAADATGDLELRLGVRATEAGHGLRGQRNPATVLRLTQHAQRIAGDRPSLGLALVVCSKAKALSALGDHDGARQALSVCGELFNASANPTGIMPGYWQGGQLPFAENAIYAAAGDESGMAQARARWHLSGNSDYQIPTVLRLHEALCTVVNGGTDTGAREAADILAALPPPQQDHMIIETGRDVLHAVPLDQRELPAVRELRALTSGRT